MDIRMGNMFEKYYSVDFDIPERNLGWNLYGKGLESLGRADHPEVFSVLEPKENELLVRVDAVGICYSDVKLIRQGGDHPKLYNRNLKNKPARLGHEVALTVVRVGKKLVDRFAHGDRLSVQPDIFQNGKSTAYGYVIPGGFIQYQILGPEILKGEADSYAIPLKDHLGFAETALTEPWACVEAAYSQRRRLEPKSGGTMWLIGCQGDTAEYTFPLGKNIPAVIVATNIPNHLLQSLKEQTSGKQVRILERNEIETEHYSLLLNEFTEGSGFDDIIILDPQSSKQITESAKLLARRGIFNIIGKSSLDQPVQIDAGRVHYDYIAFLGNRGPNVTASYGEARNRCELKKNGIAVFVGAGGPMGQMHVQRALELSDGPDVLIAVDINNTRLDFLASRFSHLAKSHSKVLKTFNPAASEETLYNHVMKISANQGADDVIVCAPSPEIMAESAKVMALDGMLVLFAGVPNGTMIPLDLSSVYLNNAQYTGTSGSDLEDQKKVIQKTAVRQLSPNRSVAAIGGIKAVKDGIYAAQEGRFPGKVIIFPQLTDLKLTSIRELHDKIPEVARHLENGDIWTFDAEKALIEKFWKP